MKQGIWDLKEAALTRMPDLVTRVVGRADPVLTRVFDHQAVVASAEIGQATLGASEISRSMTLRAGGAIRDAGKRAEAMVAVVQVAALAGAGIFVKN